MSTGNTAMECRILAIRLYSDVLAAVTRNRLQFDETGRVTEPVAVAEMIRELESISMSTMLPGNVLAILVPVFLTQVENTRALASFLAKYVGEGTAPITFDTRPVLNRI